MGGREAGVVVGAEGWGWGGRGQTEKGKNSLRASLSGLSSKFCQNWLRLPLTGHSLSPPHLSTDGVGALRKAWVLIRLCKQLNIASKHARRREARPPRVDPNTKRFKRTLTNVIMTRTHNVQIFGEIPFVKPQNDT